MLFRDDQVELTSKSDSQRLNDSLPVDFHQTTDRFQIVAHTEDRLVDNRGHVRFRRGPDISLTRYLRGKIWSFVKFLENSHNETTE